ncbi:head-tail connector protein [Mangrovibrevibacter kandeliae]|uniref:head-tail connector protein n=1 Tax=Mangrovibrevibacter kandeliae TaxID=2968473 RepID=UPI0021177DA9|nr:phage head-tail connector protein [Aurantimonas sp. CSK15Z-1]MCQ8781079.1 phage head-tail connector protein [Aurantimonas sp. CSK15Z-1]
MTLIELAETVIEPVTVAEARSWCRIERDDEDELVASLVRAARQAVETETGLVLVRRAFRLALDPVPPGGWIEVARRPLQVMVGVTAYGSDGAPIVFGEADAIIERALGIEAIRLSPAVRAVAANGVDVDFEAGYAPGEAPGDLLLALKRTIAASYEVRGATGEGWRPAVLPPSAQDLTRPHRRMRL